MTETLEQTLTAYDTWLDRQPLAAKTRVAYRFQVHQSGFHATSFSCASRCRVRVFLQSSFPRIFRKNDVSLPISFLKQALRQVGLSGCDSPHFCYLEHQCVTTPGSGATWRGELKYGLHLLVSLWFRWVSYYGGRKYGRKDLSNDCRW